MKLEQVRQAANSLPSVTEESHFDRTSFRVGGKIFATVPNEGEYLHVFVEERQREVNIALEPEVLEELFWGERAVGLRVSLAKARPKLVERLLRQAWLRKAPKHLLATAPPDEPRGKS